MDKSAIEQIQQSGALPQLIKAIDTADKPVIALPKDFELHDLERYLDAPTAYRGDFTTNSLDDFVRYVEVHQKFNTSCFINADKMRAITYFDLGSQSMPGHGEHKAHLQLERTAQYNALLNFTNNHHNQKTVAEWLEDWAYLLTAYGADGEPLDMKKVITGVRSINIEALRETSSEVEQLSARKSALESIAARGKEQLPAQIHWRSEPYQALSERSFAMRLSLRTTSDPLLCLQIIKYEQAVEEMAQEFSALVTDHLGEGINVLVGTFQKG